MSSIVVKNLSVHYPVYGAHHYSLRRAIVHLTTAGKAFRGEQSVKVVQALQDINFTLHQGDRLALIGGNGAGKSTLLKTLAQLYQPASGSLYIDGRVSALFDVCMGMDVERTGYHNIHYVGTLLGLSREQIERAIPDIETFSELGHFLKMPVRTYSLGMAVRLGYAICTSIEPAILLLDEVIGAADKHFFEKAAERAKKLYERAEILVMASHVSSVLKEFCNKGLWLEKGKMVMFGPVDDVLAAYENQ